MRVNFNVRLCDNDAVFVQYQHNGGAKEAAFVGWPEFIAWLQEQVLDDKQKEK